MPNKKPDDEKKLIVKNEDYIVALYCILQSMGDPVVIGAEAFKELSFCKEKILVEYNADTDDYRFRIRPSKRKRSILMPRRKIISR